MIRLNDAVTGILVFEIFPPLYSHRMRCYEIATQTGALCCKVDGCENWTEMVFVYWINRLRVYKSSISVHHSGTSVASVQHPVIDQRVKSVLLYGSESRPLRTESVRRQSTLMSSHYRSSLLGGFSQ